MLRMGRILMVFVILFALISCKSDSGGGAANSLAITFPTSGSYAYSDGVALGIYLEINGSNYETSYYDIINDQYFIEYGTLSASATSVTFTAESYYPTGCDALGSESYGYTTTPSMLTLSHDASDFVIIGEKVNYDQAAAVGPTAIANCW